MSTLHFDDSQRDVTSVVISAHGTEVRVEKTELGFFVTNATTNMAQYGGKLCIDIYPGAGLCAWRLKGPNISISSNRGSIRIGGLPVGSDDGIPTVYLPADVKIVEASGHVTDMRGHDLVANVGAKGTSWILWFLLVLTTIIAIAVLWI